MRTSLYLKDDDYRLSFLYGNFTTLTRFTEADLERVVTEQLGPLYVSIHATDPDVRTRLLRNRRGATSLRWLELLLDAGIEVHGQVVVCPGINDGAVLDDTLLGVLDRFPTLATVGVVPLGVSAHSHEPEMRAAHRRRGASASSTSCDAWQARFLAALGRRLVYASDEYYLLAERPFPAARRVRRLPAARERHRHGAHVRGRGRAPRSPGADVEPHRHRARASSPGSTARPPRATARRACRSTVIGRRADRRRRRPRAPIGDHHRGARRGGARAARARARRARRAPRAARAGREPVLRRQHRRHRPAHRRRRRRRARRRSPTDDRYLLPDVVLSRGRFLDGDDASPSCRAPVEIVATDGAALVRARHRAAS